MCKLKEKKSVQVVQVFICSVFHMQTKCIFQPKDPTGTTSTSWALFQKKKSLYLSFQNAPHTKKDVRL